MSVITAFDEKIEQAKEKISEAYKLLLESLDENIWGFKDMDPSYISRVQEVLTDLFKSKIKL